MGRNYPNNSTRAHFDKLTGNSITTQPYIPLDNEILNNICLENEAIVYVHGVWTNERGHSISAIENAYEVFERLKMSLENVGYTYPLIGFSWDSDTEILPSGWEYAKLIAKGNGPKLAQFLLDLKNYCIEHHDNNIEIRLVGPSLGSRVILSSFDSLDNNNEWNLSDFKILTVNLLGGAVDNYEILKNNHFIPIDSDIKAYYGDAIENQVSNFYNMHNLEDDVLEEKRGFFEWWEPEYYPSFEVGNLAIGQNPLSEITPSMPSNYDNIDVMDQIIYVNNADNDSDRCDLQNTFRVCTINGTGDNHLGYIGFRNSDDSLMDNGDIDKVVNTWNFP
ncbi:MAG: hypothetical protein ACXWFC_07445 [Nitrososphaeraceae archaeon]